MLPTKCCQRDAAKKNDMPTKCCQEKRSAANAPSHTDTIRYASGTSGQLEAWCPRKSCHSRQSSHKSITQASDGTRQSSGQSQQHMCAQVLPTRTLCIAEGLSRGDRLTGLADVHRTFYFCYFLFISCVWFCCAVFVERPNFASPTTPITQRA